MDEYFQRIVQSIVEIVAQYWVKSHLRAPDKMQSDSSEDTDKHNRPKSGK